METTTLDTLLTKSRLYAQEREVGHLTNTEIAIFVNDAARGVRSQIMSRAGGQLAWETSESVSLTSSGLVYEAGATSTSWSTLASLLDSVSEVYISWGTTQVERIEQVPAPLWEQLNRKTWVQGAAKGWRMGVSDGRTYLAIAPPPLAGTVASVHYLPAWSELAATTDSCTGPEGFGEAVAVSSAIAIRGMQDLSTTYLEKLLALAFTTCQQASERLRRAFGAKVLDVTPLESRYPHYGLRGEGLPDP